jgi:hypothetical protein
VIKKTIQYTDLDGKPVSVEWHFSMDAAELLEMKTSSGTGLYAALEAITGNGDKTMVMGAFREIMLASVGRREGQRFVKNNDLRDEFKQTGAYAALFLEFMTNTMAAVDFIMGIVPADLASKFNIGAIRQQMADAGIADPAVDQVLTELQGRMETGNAPTIAQKDQDDAKLVQPMATVQEEIFWAGKTASELQNMPASELTELINASSGNIPKSVVALAMQKRHADNTK